MKQQQKLYLLILGLVVIAGLFFIYTKYLRHPSKPSQARTQPTGVDDKPDYSGITVEKVVTFDTFPGKGDAVKDGDTVNGKFGMWVYNPRKLANKGLPISGGDKLQDISFKVGAGTVVRGFEQGVIGMRPGGKRNIIIPVALGYGERGNPKVPAGSILLVEFELNGPKRAAALPVREPRQTETPPAPKRQLKQETSPKPSAPAPVPAKAADPKKAKAIKEKSK